MSRYAPTLRFRALRAAIEGGLRLWLDTSYCWVRPLASRLRSDGYRWVRVRPLHARRHASRSHWVRLDRLAAHDGTEGTDAGE